MTDVYGSAKISKTSTPGESVTSTGLHHFSTPFAHIYGLPTLNSDSYKPVNLLYSICPARNRDRRTIYKRENEEARTGYIRHICKIAKDESVDLWVSCSGVASAVEDAMVKEALGKMSLERRAPMDVVRVGVRGSCRGSGLDRSDSAQCRLSLHCEVPRYLIRRGMAANPPPGNFWQLPWAGTKSAWVKTKTSLSSTRTPQTALSPIPSHQKHSSVSAATQRHGRLQE